MKLVERKNKLTDGFGVYLEDIKQDDICYSNLEGRPNTYSAYYDPNKAPEHHITLWFKEYDEGDMDILNQLRAVNVNISGPRNEYEMIMNSTSQSDYIKAMQEELLSNKALAAEMKKHNKYSVKFKAYPKVREYERTDYATGEVTVVKEQKPKVMMRTQNGNKSTRLDADQFKFVDGGNIAEMNFKFHLFKYNEHQPNTIPVLDEVYVVAQERDTYQEDDYLEKRMEEKYGALPSVDEAVEELPFN